MKKLLLVMCLLLVSCSPSSIDTNNKTLSDNLVPVAKINTFSKIYKYEDSDAICYIVSNEFSNSSTDVISCIPNKKEK